MEYVGRFSYSMNKERFQKKYAKMREELFQHQYKEKLFTIVRDEDGNDYEKYINDVLRTMRKGRREYVYTWSQLADLVRFEYDKLNVKFDDAEEYVEVWLK